MDARDYLRESARTAAGTFHQDLVNPAEMDFMLQAVIAAGGWADRIKRALFYGKQPGPPRWRPTGVAYLRNEVPNLR
jgi:hypothetical protein